jgi:pimeloyl-ACP methyl ester carboxylesterase
VSERAVVEFEGCLIHFRVAGRGPAVLFIQGVGVHGDGWRPQVDVCARDYSCLTFDNRGVGRSVPAGRPLSVPQMARDARAVLDAAGVERAHVVGHSLGGLIALQLALTERSRLLSLALLCTFASGRAAAPLTPRMIWLGLRSRVGTRRMRRAGFLGLVLPPGAVTDVDTQAAGLAGFFGHDLGDQDPATSAQLRAMRGCDVSARLGELAGLPTLVVSARHDPIAPPGLSRQMATGIPGAVYMQADMASHGLPISHAEWTNAALKQHWEGGGQGR